MRIWVRSGVFEERGKRAGVARLAGLGSFGAEARSRVLNELEVKWVRLVRAESDQKNADAKDADGPTEVVGAGPAIAAGTPRATGKAAGKDRRRYGWHSGTTVFLPPSE